MDSKYVKMLLILISYRLSTSKNSSHCYEPLNFQAFRVTIYHGILAENVSNYLPNRVVNPLYLRLQMKALQPRSNLMMYRKQMLNPDRQSKTSSWLPFFTIVLL